jgi:hypothetical protein
MIVCNLFAIAIGYYAIQQRGVGPQLPVEMPAMFTGFGIPELLATASLGQQRRHSLVPIATSDSRSSGGMERLHPVPAVDSIIQERDRLRVERANHTAVLDPLSAQIGI